MTIRLIAIDVDGTLLDSRKQIRPAVKEALAKAACANIRLALCTGRSPREIEELSGRLPQISYGITANGAYVVDLRSGELVFSDTMGVEELQSVYRTLAGFDMMFEIFTERQVLADKRCLANPDHYGVGPLRQLVVSTRTGIGDLGGALMGGRIGEAGKINIFFPDSAARDRAGQMAEHLPFYMTSQEPTNLEFTKKEVNKAQGLRKLAEKLGVRRECIMAIGDNNNDLPMIEYAGIGVAMANGLENVRRAADFVTASNEEDGVARAIERFVFKRLNL